jgi:uncharacterized protein YjbJ (UPF0337 family)
MDKDRVKDTARDVMGKIKETLAKATGGKSTQTKSKSQAAGSTKTIAAGATKSQAGGAAKSRAAGGKKSQAGGKAQKTSGRAKGSAKK